MGRRPSFTFDPFTVKGYDMRGLLFLLVLAIATLATTDSRAGCFGRGNFFGGGQSIIVPNQQFVGGYGGGIQSLGIGGSCGGFGAQQIIVGNRGFRRFGRQQIIIVGRQRGFLGRLLFGGF